MQATYTKLKSGAWGVRVQGAVTAGQVVTVTKRDGSSRSEMIERVLWSGNNICLCAITSTQRQSRGPSWARDGGAWTGCSMGCRDGAPNPHCRSCWFDEYDF